MITKVEAINFLKQHQPMPSDDEIKEEEIAKYEEVRKIFINNSDKQCIPLFLNSFGGKDGLGVYQMVEDVIRMYDDEKVLPHILQALNSPHIGVRYWNVEISSNFPSKELFIPLSKILQCEDTDIKCAAITALAQLALKKILTNEVVSVIKEECESVSVNNEM